MWFARFDLSCGFSAYFASFFRGCSSGGMVGFGWWLYGVLGLFTMVRDRGASETEMRETSRRPARCAWFIFL